MNRGSLGDLLERHAIHHRFNEAPIHESGKCACARRGDRARRSFNEAPIHESGKFSRTPELATAMKASMRPRFMNRGSIDYVGALDVAPPGFNEAPIHESGKSRASLPSERLPSRFNEAPIHESGKSRHSSSIQGAVRGFNEAPIHESGKY